MRTDKLFTEYKWEYKRENGYITFKRKNSATEDYEYVFIIYENEEVYLYSCSLPTFAPVKLSTTELKLFIKFGEAKSNYG